MNKMTNEELLSIIDRYGFDLEMNDVWGRGINKDKSVYQQMPSFAGGDMNWILRHIAAWILDYATE